MPIGYRENEIVSQLKAIKIFNTENVCCAS
jgi:hypothetical protein